MLQLLAVASFLALPAPAQVVELVADLDTTPVPQSSWPGGVEGDDFVAFAGKLYFRAWTEAAGMELWCTDGSTAGTTMVGDLVPGPLGSDPRELLVHGGQLWFLGHEPATGRELWRSDGTAAGTVRVTDLAPGPADADVVDLAGLGSELYFFFDDGVHGLELWSTDGTAAGTGLVHDSIPGPGSLEPEQLTALPASGVLVWSGDVPGAGREPVVFDPSVGSPAPLADINPGAAFSSYPWGFTPYGGRLLFVADDGAIGRELWATDGTTAGTVLVADISATSIGSYPYLTDAVEHAGDLYFSASSATGRELWRTDGTTAGTLQACELSISSTQPYSSSDPSDLAAMGGELFFAATATEGGNVGRELWATQGTQATTRLVKDLAVGLDGTPENLVAYGGQLYFRASNGLEDTEPWVSDGTTAGTQRLADLAPGALSSTPTGFAGLPGVGMVFAANNAPGDLPVQADVELYLSDGTPGGTGLLVDIEPGHITGNSGGDSFVATSGRELFYTAADPVVGDEPRYRDGSGVITLLADLWPGPDSSSPEQATPVWVDGKLLTFFTAYEPGIGRELYVTDGTPTGTGLVADIRPGSTSSEASKLHAGPGKLFLRAMDFQHGLELWVSDGTSAGTQMLELATGLAGSWPDFFVNLDDKVLFAATVGGDREVWISDGTSAGTLELADLNPNNDSAPSQLTRVDQEVAFFARAVGFSSWQSLAATDGTAAGTRVVFDPGMNLFIKGAGIAVLDGIAYFLASTPVGIELWRSDLTTAGTFAVAVVPSSTYGVDDWQLTAADGRIFFRAIAQDSGGNELGVELFTSDGTAAGTELVLDLAPGADGSRPYELTPAGGGVYFVLQDDEVTPLVEPARELFFSDGTATGTYQVGTRPPGELPWAPTELLSSKPTGLTLVDGDLYFVAEDPHAVGRELFRLVDPVAYVQVLEPSGSGQRLEAGAAELGGTVTIRATGAPAGALSLLAMGGTLALPSTTLVLPDSAAWIDPLTASILSATVTESWSISLPVPAAPGLAGLAMTLQSWTLVGPGLLPAETSNGLAFVLGL